LCRTSVVRQAMNRVMHCLVGLMLLLPGLPAQAIDYVFPGNLPAVCSGSGGAYICGVLTIDAGDTISFEALTPVVVNFTGALTSGDNTKINEKSIPANLTINVTGVLTIGNSSTLNANINVIGAGTVGASSSIGGYLSATTTTGVLTVGANTLVTGFISTDAGAVNIGAAVVVGGGITTDAGVVTVGSIAKIGGNISTVAGAITVGDGSTICGNVGSTGAGIVSLNMNVKVGGNINTTAGAITVLAGSAINGNIISANGGVITLTGVLVGGNLSTTGAAITLTSSRVQGTALPAGSVTLTSSTVNDSALSIAKACSLPLTSAAAIAFECLEAGASYVNIQRVPSAHVPLYTKLAGTAFAFDLVALKADGTIESDYVASGGNSKNVKLELVDGSDRTACADRSLITPIVSQSLSFSATDAGRKQSATMTVSNAYANLRCRVTDSNQTPSVVACSSDNFAVRPLALLVTQNTPTLNAGSTFTLQAQAVMDYLTPPTTATNYSGVPALNPGQITGTPGFTQTALAPQPFPTATNGISNATFTYDEVGSFTLPASAPSTYGISDSSFTGVDGSTDCIPNSASNTLDSSGKYGCLIGQSAALTVGRFYPDHFDIASAVTPGCPAGGFTYMDQPFTLGYTVTAKSMSRGSPNPPGNLPLTLYSGGQLYFAAINAGTDWVTRLSSAVTTPLTPTWINGSYTQASKPMTFTRPTTATADATWGPFDALDIGVAIDDADSVGYAATIPTFSAKTPTQCSNSAGTACRQYASLTGGTTTKMRIGRIRLSNAYGSERLNLIIPMALEYWTTNGWQKNSLDTCTPFTNSNFSFSFPSGTTTKPNNLVACNTALTFTGRASTYVQTLSAPGVGKTGWADISLNLGTTSFGAQCVALGSAGGPANPLAMPWLQFGGISANANPSARATFGIFKSPMIYRRENY